jgi:hypothetical protein
VTEHGFRSASHLPKVGGRPADPDRLPRQRNGATPQMHGRYPDYNVLDEAGHWDALTRDVIESRISSPPRRRFFSHDEFTAVKALCDTLLAQDREPRIPVASYVDDKLARGQGDGFRYEDLPDDPDTWRLVAQGLDQEARRRGADSFAALDQDGRDQVESDFADGKLSGGAWKRLNVGRAHKVVMRSVLEGFYSHPWSWNEIGFGGPAYPRGYQALGPNGAEPWEHTESFHRDPGREPPPPEE